MPINADVQRENCMDAESGQSEGMLAMDQHTHTHSCLQQSEVSEPVRGLWLDAAREQAGQKHCLSPLIK